MAKQLTVQELEEKIKTLEGIGENQAAQKYKEELKKLRDQEGQLPEGETKAPAKTDDVGDNVPPEEVADTPPPEEVAQEAPTEVASEPTGGEAWMTIPVSKTEWDIAGGRASAGLHLAEMKMPKDDTPGVSIAFPFELIGEGDPDAGKKGKVSAGVLPAAVWKVKEILNNLKVPYVFITKDGVEYPAIEITFSNWELLELIEKGIIGTFYKEKSNDN